MEDIGATHNFIREEAVSKFELKFSLTQACLKAVNSPPNKVINMAKNLDVNIGE